MSDVVSDGTSFSCPLCTGKLKIAVPNSPASGDSKPLAHTGNFLFPPPPGAQCLLIPSAPAPCAPPSVSVIMPGQSTVEIDGKKALGAGCKLQCAKGGLLAVDSSGQSSAQHDGASSGIDWEDLLWKLADVALLLLSRGKAKGALSAIRASRKAQKAAKAAKQASKIKTKSTPPPKSAKPSKTLPRSKKGSEDPKLPKDPFKDPEYENVSHPDAAKNGHYKFKNKNTGEIVQYDKGKPGAPGHEGVDHYHKPNPNRASKLDHYLDGEGNPVPKGSDASHVYPPD